MSDRKVWRLGELLIQGEPDHERPYIGLRKDSRRDELVTIQKLNGRLPWIWEKDTVALDLAFPQEALLTDPPKKGDMSTSEAKHTFQGVGTTPDLSPPPNGNTSNGVYLLSRSDTSPLRSSHEALPIQVRDGKKTKMPLLFNGSDPNLANPKSNLPTYFRDQSSNGYMTQTDTSSKNTQAALERSYMYTTIINLPPESGHHKPPELTISPTYIIYSSADIHEANASPKIPRDKSPTMRLSPTSAMNYSLENGLEIPPDIPDSKAWQDTISERQELIESISDGRRHPESIPGSEDLEMEDRGNRPRREAKLNTLYSKTLQSRSLGYQKRSQLRYLRTQINAADEDFMKHVREKRVQASHDDLVLGSSFTKLQAVREEYGSLEEAYNGFEELLDRQEYEITQLQTRILDSIQEGRDDDDVSSVSGSSDKENEENLEDMQDPNHPLYEEYLSRLGDADLCREEHFNLLVQHESLLEQEEVRQRYGERLQPRMEIILAKFPAEEAKILERLREIEADIERLRGECIQEGLLGEGRGKECESESEGSDILKSSNGSLGLEQNEYRKYPILLQQPDRPEDEEWSKSLITRFKTNDTGDRITRWLLHKLRSSCSEVELLVRYSEGLGPTVDTEKWQEEVLDFWFLDAANLPPSAYRLEPTLTAFPPSITDLNKAVQTRFGDGEFIQLVIRSSSLSRKLEFGIWLRLARMKGKSAMTV